jgi:hypothetical protein
LCYDAAISSLDITPMLTAWGEGDEAALDRLTSALYPEIRLSSAETPSEPKVVPVTFKYLT